MPRNDDLVRIDLVREWFATHARQLPWREPDCGPWGVLVSEFMLQQTQVSRVEPVWREWMARWPRPVDLASATQADAIRAWGRLGYPRRAQRLWQCAGALVAQHGGEVPGTEEELLRLPGVGPYTAAAVVAFAFGGASVVLDTNVRRVIARAWNGEGGVAPHVTASERVFAARLAEAAQRGGSGQGGGEAGAAAWAAGSMELGALVCTAREPDCDDCPLFARCAWVHAGRPPAPATRRSLPWKGSDRRVRGMLLAALREASGPVDPRFGPEFEGVPHSQVEACIAALIADGLVVAAGGERLELADGGATRSLPAPTLTRGEPRR